MAGFIRLPFPCLVPKNPRGASTFGTRVELGNLVLDRRQQYLLSQEAFDSKHGTLATA